MSPRGNTRAIRNGVDMNYLDKQIMAAERDLDAFGHGGWMSPAAAPLQSPADKMHALLVERADALIGCTERAMLESTRVARRP
jgi:hypothetical protein